MTLSKILSHQLFNKKLQVYKTPLNTSGRSLLLMCTQKLLVSIFHGLVNKRHKHGLHEMKLFWRVGKNSQVQPSTASILLHLSQAFNQILKLFERILSSLNASRLSFISKKNSSTALSKMFKRFRISCEGGSMTMVYDLRHG